MERALSVASITVAYNSERTLPRQIDALLRQTRSLQEIVIVDNASTDRTREMLSARYPQVTVLSLSENTGVGGGYAAGLAYAVKERRHDWMWLLDDDSTPMAHGLRELLAGIALPDICNERMGILASVPTHNASRTSYPGMLWRNRWIIPEKETVLQPAWFVDVVISSGSLVHREAVEVSGLPRADFFMDFVDFEYCFRMRRHGYKIAVVRDSQLEHTIGEPRAVKILGYSKSWPVQQPWREYYSSRNYTFTIWDYFPNWRSKAYVLWRLLRHAVGIVAFGTNKFACLKMMLTGFLDGCSGRLGVRFRADGASKMLEPSVHASEVSVHN
jgi:GT2 family glycosyltransferase